MLADFYIPRLSNDMKIAVQKNHLAGQILYRTLHPPKKRGKIQFFLKKKIVFGVFWATLVKCRI